METMRKKVSFYVILKKINMDIILTNPAPQTKLTLWNFGLPLEPMLTIEIYKSDTNSNYMI